MKAGKSRALGVAAVTLMIAVPLLVIMAARPGTRTLNPGQSLRLDDFFFTMDEATVMPAEVADPDRGGRLHSAKGRSYRVRIRVDNRARRVPFTFRGDRFALIDAAATAPPLHAQAERAGPGEWLPLPLHTHLLPAGKSATVDYLFMAPEGLGDPRLILIPSDRVAGFLDWLLSGRTMFRLFEQDGGDPGEGAAT